MVPPNQNYLNWINMTLVALFPIVTCFKILRIMSISSWKYKSELSKYENNRYLEFISKRSRRIQDKNQVERWSKHFASCWKLWYIKSHHLTFSRFVETGVWTISGGARPLSIILTASAWNVTVNMSNGMATKRRIFLKKGDFGLVVIWLQLMKGIIGSFDDNCGQADKTCYE